MQSSVFILLNIGVFMAIFCLYFAYQYFLVRKRIKANEYRDLPIG